MSTTTQTLRRRSRGNVTFDDSETWIGYSLFLLRIVMGWTLFQGGVTKLVTDPDADPENNWTAAGFLLDAVPEGNPSTGLFGAMAGNPVVDRFNMLGLTLTGLALLVILSAVTVSRYPRPRGREIRHRLTAGSIRNTA